MTTDDWDPGRIRLVKSLQTSTRVSRIRTERGYVWVKTMNNPQGPHALVSELIGYTLAKRIELPTPPFLVHDFGTQSGVMGSAPGPSFVTFDIEGRAWDGTTKDFENVGNARDIVGLVVLDTWLRNVDRFAKVRSLARRNIGNVFLAGREGRSKRYLVALDHSEAIRESCGEIQHSIRSINQMRDEYVYGMFPELTPFIAHSYKDRYLQRLASFEKREARELVDAIPEAWQVRQDARDAIASFLYDRARFLCEHLVHALTCWPEQRDLFAGGGSHG